MKVPIILLALFFLLPACFAEKDRDSQAAASPSANPFQEQAVKLFMENKEAKNAYLLLSSSGYVDNGQHFVMDSGTQATFYLAKPGEKELRLGPALTEEKRTAFLEAMQECRDLGSLESKIYDGVQYRFIRYTKLAGAPSDIQNLTMNNPELVQGATPHQSLVRSFLSLAN